MATLDDFLHNDVSYERDFGGNNGAEDSDEVVDVEAGDGSDDDANRGADLDAGGGNDGEDDAHSDASTPAKSQRIRLNNAEKYVVITAGLAHKCPTRNGEDLKKVIEELILPHCVKASVDMTFAQREVYEDMARGGYRRKMRGLTVKNVVDFFQKGIKRLRKDVKVEDGEKGEDGEPLAAVRSGGKFGDGMHLLDQSVLQWGFEYNKTISGTSLSAAKGKTRIRQAKGTKFDAREKRKAYFEEENKKKKVAKEAKEAEKRENDRKFNEEMDAIAASGRSIATSIETAAAASVALTNFRLFKRLPAQPLTMAQSSPAHLPASNGGAPGSSSN